jgi:hypothetical protein
MRVLDVIAAGAALLAVREILRLVKVRADRGDRREALHTWEAEGGAVPVSRSTTVAQVSPPPDAVLPS